MRAVFWKRFDADKCVTPQHLENSIVALLNNEMSGIKILCGWSLELGGEHGWV